MVHRVHHLRKARDARMAPALDKHPLVAFAMNIAVLDTAVDTAVADTAASLPQQRLVRDLLRLQHLPVHLELAGSEFHR